MYGIDKENYWYDYDLKSAYTTVLFKIGHPNYSKGKKLNQTELLQMTNDEILFSYIIIQCNFIFPDDVKYPSIPVYVNNITIYPLKGEALLTGSEFLLAKSQKCKFLFKEIYYIPFSDEYPFKNIITKIQNLRNSFPKGSINNLMYKEIGNSIYGSIVRGLNEKLKFDNKTGTQKRIPANFLSNPILGSWITAFIRSIIGECLHVIQKLNGKVVSVTTDGFISDIKDLENKMENYYLFSKYKELRFEISKNNESLEIKNEGIGIIS
jgi:hypothetical protein